MTKDGHLATEELEEFHFGRLKNSELRRSFQLRRVFGHYGQQEQAEVKLGGSAITALQKRIDTHSL